MGSAVVYVWRKIVRTSRAGAWSERVFTLVAPERLEVVHLVGRGTDRLEVYCGSRPQAQRLVARLGGRVRELTPGQWQPASVTARGRPLRIGARLLVTSHDAELASLRAARPDRRVLCIPAAMAFGTGEHATTAMCLRLLVEAARGRAAGSWNLLDLGTGSGILALAGRLFGARRALGLDHDPHAVRTARQNARRNRLASPAVRFTRADLLRAAGPPEPRSWDVVTANLFSELLIRLMPGTLAPAVAPGGHLILSGVLATQSDGVIRAAEAAGLALLTVRARGRWRAFHCLRAA